jgi:hypothetical protein
MTTNNRDDFDQCIALVFEKLYQAFPRGIDILIEELGESLDEETTDNYFASIRFLQREGFIHYQELDFTVFIGVILTAKGLKILDTIKAEKTIAQHISAALTNNNQNAIRAVSREIIKLSV